MWKGFTEVMADYAMKMRRSAFLLENVVVKVFL
jgi:hypothetical protein